MLKCPALPVDFFLFKFVQPLLPLGFLEKCQPTQIGVIVWPALANIYFIKAVDPSNSPSWNTKDDLIQPVTRLPLFVKNVVSHSISDKQVKEISVYSASHNNAEWV